MSTRDAVDSDTPARVATSASRTGPSGAFADAVGIPELTGPFALGTVEFHDGGLQTLTMAPGEAVPVDLMYLQAIELTPVEGLRIPARPAKAEEPWD